MMTIKIEKSPDMKRLEQFERLRDNTQWVTLTKVEMIQNEKMRLEAVEYIKEISDCYINLLLHIQKTAWYMGKCEEREK